MNYYLLNPAEGYNTIRYRKVEDWQDLVGNPSSLKFRWIAPDLEFVLGERSSKNKIFDLSCANEPFFTVSKEALIHLEVLLLKYGELLPFKEPFENFVFFHCTNIVDALIEDKSDISWLDKEKGWIGGINKFVLDKTKIGDSQIVRLPNANYRYTLFGEEFKELVVKNKLVGINFNRWEKIEVI